MKALVTANFSEDGLARLEKLMEVTYEPWGDSRKITLSDELAERLKSLGADVVIIEADLCHEEVFEEVDLKMIGVCRGDPLNVDVELATEKGIPVFYTPGRNADAVADLTLGFMLCLSRRIIELHNLLTGPDYIMEEPDDYLKIYRKYTGFELGSRTVGIVGFGAIGRGVARRLQGFGANVLAYDPFVNDELLKDYGAERVELKELFSKSDIITLHVAVTDETEGMITRELLERMKPSAYFLNLARTELVDQAALVEILKDKRIAGGAFDVFTSEPPQKNDPLLGLDNVIVTPHLGGATEDVIKHQTDMIVGDMEAYLKGMQPVHIYNPEVLEKKK
jgi:phosphoglycerate dehydrogenase-like enzyme